jgi:TnpA family transposase
MASIERTAYPRFPRTVTLKDLQASFTPDGGEIDWAKSKARGTNLRIALATLLKCFQYLHYFPSPKAIPPEIVEHVSASLGLPSTSSLDYGGPLADTMYRHHNAIRNLLGVHRYDDKTGRKLLMRVAHEAASVVNTRTDLINIAINEMVRLGYELPVFRTLDDIAEQIHTAAEADLHIAIAQKLSPEQRKWLDDLLSGELPARQTRYNQLKRSAKKSSRKHLDALIEQLQWLESLPDCDQMLAGVPTTKVKHMEDVAAALDAGDMKDLRPAKRHALILALIYQMRVRARDDIAEMFIRRISAIHKTAREELVEIQKRQRELSEHLVATLDDVLEILGENLDDATTGARVRELLAPHGDLNRLREDCAAIRVWSGSNHLPLVWKPFSSHRAVMFRMAQALHFEAPGPDHHLLDALNVVLANEHRKAEWIEEDVNLEFASERWRKLVRRSLGHGNPTNRRLLEICVFSHLASELRSGGICVEGSESFADYRRQLVPWEACEAMLPSYCARVGIPETATEFVDGLRALLRDTAQRLDDEFPTHAGDVVIGRNGEPTLKRLTAKEVPPSAIALQAAIESRVPPRNILDILANIEHWTGFTRHFGPLSGDEPKLRNARERYLLTVFALGCNLGPNQAARHLSNGVTPHQLSYTNRRHLGLDQLDNACRDLTELYLRLDLPKLWGEGKKVAADGTQYDFYDQNLLAGMHFRYRKMGAVAYRHVADNYIAYFRHFIPPGVLEAIYVIEGLLKAGLSVEPDTVYSDTHGQSETVFAYTHLVGVQLMPRIRGWKDLTFYRPDRSTRYRHIDGLFTDVVDWKLILDHWPDLMQVAISVQQGKVASPILLRKLSAEGRNNRLFRASRELGRALRTVYLLRWIGSKDMRQEVTGTTNKIESYHAFTKWLDFGGEVINENDPVEQQKRLRYLDLVASAVILQNTVDMTRVLQDMYHRGEPVDVSDIGFLSPYGRNFKRFGDYRLDLKKPPEAWLKEALFKEAARQTRKARQTPDDSPATPAAP